MSAVITQRKGGARRQATEEGGTFRVVVGVHIGEGPPGCACAGCAGGETWPEYLERAEREKAAGVQGGPYKGGRSHHYESYLAYLGRCHREHIPEDERLLPEEYTGDVFESKVDMERRHNRPNSIKFERVGGQRSYASAPAPFPLEQMSVDQLFTVAASEGIDTKGVRSHEALLAKVRERRGQPAPAESDSD